MTRSGTTYAALLTFAVAGIGATLFLWFFMIQPSDAVKRANKALVRLEAETTNRTQPLFLSRLTSEGFSYKMAIAAGGKEATPSICIAEPTWTLLHPNAVLKVRIDFNRDGRVKRFTNSSASTAAC